jgi:hypothetical protein
MTLAVQVRIPGVRRPGGNNSKKARQVSGPKGGSRRCLRDCHQRACRIVDIESGMTHGRFHLHIAMTVKGVSVCFNTTPARLFHLDHSARSRHQARIIAVLWTSVICNGISKVSARYGDVRDVNEIRMRA